MSLLVHLVALTVYCTHQGAEGLSISQRDVRESAFPQVPGYTSNRLAYIVGAYAIFEKGIVRFTSLPSSQIQQSLPSGRAQDTPQLLDLDKWTGKKFFCLYASEVIQLETYRTRMDNINTLYCMSGLKSTLRIVDNTFCAGGCPAYNNFLDQ